MKNKKILLFGYYGTGNLGDNALVYSITEKLTKNLQCKVNVLLDKAAKIKVYNDEHVFKSYYPLKSRSVVIKTLHLIKHLLRAEIFAFGGGGKVNLSSKGQMKAIKNKVNLARFFRCKVWFLNIGVEGVATDDTRLLLEEILVKADIFSVRDKFSYNLIKDNIKEISKYESKIKITSDAAFGIEFNNEDAEIKDIYSQENFTLGVIPVFAYDRQDRLVEVLVFLLKKFNNLNVKFIPFHKKDDEKEIDKMITKLINKGISKEKIQFDKWSYDHNEVMKSINQCDCIISMRLHGCIFSHIAKKPLIAVGKKDHLKGFIQEAKYRKQVLQDINNVNDYTVFEELIINPALYISPVEPHVFRQKNDEFYTNLANDMK